MSPFRTFVSRPLPAGLLFFAVCVLVSAGLLLNKPAAERIERPARLPVVDVLQVYPRDYAVRLESRGTVEARTRSPLVPEVAGQIIAINDSFRAGGFFEKGDTLITIDPRNYQIALSSVRAELAQAKLALAEEQALSAQASIDWEKLGFEEPPEDLVLRIPQLENARSRVAAAEAHLELARINLERTRIRAPFAGRVLDKQVDIGQFVTPGNLLATIYAVDYAEVRLPVTDHQAAFMDVPETYRGEQHASAAGPAVELRVTQGHRNYLWQGRVVRSEGAVDPRSRQLFVVVQVDDPYGKRPDGAPPLKVGQFVEASIQGHLLRNVYALPRNALREGSEVLLITGENQIKRHGLTVIWSDQAHVVVRDGLRPGDRLVVTPLPFATDGLAVQIREQARQPEISGTGAG